MKRGNHPMNNSLRIGINCKICGKLKKIDLCLYLKGQKTCSMECRNIAKKKYPLKAICKNCGEQFKPNPCKNLVFCNRACYAEYTKRQAKRMFVCKCCGKEVKVNRHKDYYDYRSGKKEVRKYCSKNCADVGKTKPRENRICLNCDNEFEVLPMPSREKQDLLCSKKCIYEYYRGKRHPNWLGGISFEPYGIEFNNKLKMFIREQYDYTCQECGVKENGKNHVCHHVDYNKQNNQRDNLIILCRSCHMKTNFNRKYWQSYFTKNFQELNC